jgi:hypothetical protein
MVEALITNFSAFILVNPEFCRFKGMKAEEFLGKTPREVAVNLSQVGAAIIPSFHLRRVRSLLKSFCNFIRRQRRFSRFNQKDNLTRENFQRHRE